MVRSLPSPPAGPRSFLPSVLLEQLRRNVSGNWRDGKEPVSGAFCHVDIFGMQQLTEQLKLSAAERVGDAREAALREQRKSDSPALALLILLRQSNARKARTATVLSN